MFRVRNDILHGFVAALSLAVLSSLAAQASEPEDRAGALAGQVRQVSAGIGHTCALSNAGRAFCWGNNSHGQVGDGTSTHRTLPTAVDGLGTGLRAVAAGFYHSCAIDQIGAVHCWGRNAFGQLGDGSTTDSAVPVRVQGLGRDVRAISVGIEHSCAINRAGRVLCWGQNWYGQLGNGTYDDSAVPVRAQGLRDEVQAISSGLFHNCATNRNGRAFCWGDNDHGEIGDGTTTRQPAPVRVWGLPGDVRAVTAGAQHSCALNPLSRRGRAFCWGWNGSGRLGDGTETQRLLRTQVARLGNDVQAISAGSEHGCAINVAGRALCWGSNAEGQLGDGTLADRPLPRRVRGLGDGVRTIEAGGAHSCAINERGRLLCWGSNNYGQLGDGTFDDRNLPVRVAGDLHLQ